MSRESVISYDSRPAKVYRFATPYYRLETTDSLCLIPLVVCAQVEPGAGEADRVLPNLVTQHSPGGSVFVARHIQPPCKVAQSRDDDQRDSVLFLPPADAAHFVIRDEGGVSPDPVLVEPSSDRQAHR